jgi:hypothetical protein
MMNISSKFLISFHHKAKTDNLKKIAFMGQISGGSKLAGIHRYENMTETFVCGSTHALPTIQAITFTVL